MKEILLTRNKISIVDDEMFEFLNKFKWFFVDCGTGYAKMSLPKINKIQKQLAMHHMVIGYPIHGNVVDHINGNSLDNRRMNLRITTCRNNLLNKQRHRDGKLVGVQFSKQKKRRLHPWGSEIYANGKRFWLGCFATELEAHHAYLLAVNKLGNK